MRKSHFFLLSFLLSILFSCSDDDSPVDPILEEDQKTKILKQNNALVIPPRSAVIIVPIFIAEKNVGTDPRYHFYDAASEAIDIWNDIHGSAIHLTEVSTMDTVNGINPL